MANTQKFTLFDPELETWDSYLVQVSCNLEANDFTNITDNQKRAIFLSNCGRETVLWAALIQKLIQYYAPKPSCIARWHTFYRREQVEDRSVSPYMSTTLPCIANSTSWMRPSETVWLIHRRNANEEDEQPKNCQETKDVEGDEDIGDSEEDMHKMRVAAPPRHDRDREHKTAQCMGCGGNHLRAACQRKNPICRWCRKKEHLAHICRAAFPEAMPTNPEKGSSSCPHSSGNFFVKYSQFSGYLLVVITKRSLPSLLGLDWFASLGLGIT
ncbi:hypothetical protein E2320_003034, partial [Naja naja]